MNVSTNSSDFLSNAELVIRKVVPGEVAGSALAYNGAIPLNQPVTVKARSLDGGEWSALTEATFEPNVLGLPLRITEIMYHPIGDPIYEFIELHNFGFAPVNVAGFSFAGINFIFPSGAAIPGGGTIVLASDADPALFAARYPGLAVSGYFGGSLANGGERIALHDAAGNVVTAVTYSDGGTWSAAADGLGSSLVLVDPLTDQNQSSAWRASASAGGSPGVMDSLPATPLVRINELMADNAGAVPHEGTLPDWVELHNAGSTAVNLAGWSLTDDGNPRKFVLPANTSLAAGGFLVVWCDAAATSGLHTGFNLDLGGETVQLYDANTNLVDTVSFGRQLPSLSLGRLAGFADPWQLNNPTPGSANAAAPLASQSALVVNEWLANTVAGQPDWFELHNTNPTLPVSLQGLYLGNGASLHVLRGRSFVSPGGFVQLFADETTGVNHVDFKLPAGGGMIQLYDRDGALVQTVTYGAQAEGVSQGRLPNGAATIQLFAGSASPGSSNYLLTWTGPLLNEFMAENEGVVAMASGRAADWLEIRNPGAAPFDLTGMSLSFGPDEPGEWNFPAGLSIPAGGHLVIWCEDDLPATTTVVAELNSGRSLARSGDRVTLFNASAQPVDTLQFGPQVANLAVGRDGSFWRLKVSPTPGALNSANLNTGLITDLRLNEWQSNPGAGDDWLELYNANAAPVALDASFLTDDPSAIGKTKFQFSPNSFIPGRGWLRLIADGDADKGGDHVNFSLAEGGEHLMLRWANLSLVDSVDFGPQAIDTSRGRFPDGAGTFVDFTTTVSPGDSNYLPLNNVVVNEVLAHTDPPLQDAIELHNPTATPAPIGGWFLSDSSSNLKKFQVPAGLVIPAFGYLTFLEDDFNGGVGTLAPFTLNSARGDSVYLSQADGLGNLTGYRAQISFGPSANGVSFGRYQTSVGIDFAPQSVLSLGSANAYPLIGSVVIGELMADPVAVPGLAAADGEFVELQNRTAGSIPLFDPAHPSNAWRLRGAVDFTFPGGASIPANGRVLVVGFNPATNPAKLAAFAQHYGVPAGVLVFGPFSGRLASAGETLVLERPDNPQTSGPDNGLVPMLEVEHVSWSDAAPWPSTGIGAGASLQRRVAAQYANDPVNWLTGVPSSGTPNSVNPLDTDNDGMPDWWEDTHALNRNSPVDAGLDSDGDGVSNLNEFRARTNPRSDASRLAIDTISRSSGSASVGFRAQAGVAYEVQFRDALGTGVWQKLSDLPASYHVRDVAVPDLQAPPAHRYYRLRLP